MLVRGISSVGWNRDISSEDNLDKLDKIGIKPICMLVMDARHSSKMMKEVYKELMNEFKDDTNYRIISSIPGFGVVSSSYLSSLIIDINRFGSQSEFAAYFGIVPKQRDSGEHKSRCGITHRGDETGRELLVMATIAHIRVDKDRTSKISVMFDRMRARGVPAKKAYVACANRMTRIIYAMLREGRMYRQ